MMDQVRPYARARMQALGYSEWTDGFNVENIPSTILDGTFHVETGVSRGLKNTQDSQEIEQPFIVRLFLKGHRDPAATIEAASGIQNTVVYEFLRPAHRLVGAELKNVRFDTSEIEQLAESNDNSLIVRFDFTAIGMMSTR